MSATRWPLMCALGDLRVGKPPSTGTMCRPKTKASRKKGRPSSASLFQPKSTSASSPSRHEPIATCGARKRFGSVTSLYAR